MNNDWNAGESLKITRKNAITINSLSATPKNVLLEALLHIQKTVKRDWANYGDQLDEVRRTVSDALSAPAQGTPEPPKVEELPIADWRLEQIKQIRAYGLQAEPTALLLAIDDLLHALSRYFPPASQTPSNPEDVPDLYRLAYMPGVWRCPKCEFVLSKATISMSSASIGTTPEDRQSEECPNDGEWMVPVTYKESLKQCEKRLLQELESRATPASTARTDGPRLCAICTKNPALKPHGYCQECYTQWYGQTEPTITPAAPGSVPQATTAGELRERIAAATDEEMQPLRDALHAAVDSFGSDDLEQESVPQAPKAEHVCHLTGYRVGEGYMTDYCPACLTSDGASHPKDCFCVECGVPQAEPPK